MLYIILSISSQTNVNPEMCSLQQSKPAKPEGQREVEKDKDDRDWIGLEALWDGQYSTLLFRNACRDKEK